MSVTPPTIARSGESTRHREECRENHASLDPSEFPRPYTRSPTGSGPGLRGPVVQDRLVKELSKRIASESPPDSTGWRTAKTRCNRKPLVAGDGAGRSASLTEHPVVDPS